MQQPLTPDPTVGIGQLWLRSLVRQPLVYRKRIRDVEPGVRPGDWVAVYADPKPVDSNGDSESLIAPQEAYRQPVLLGYGLYNPRAEIALRMMRFGEALPDETFWDQLLDQAVSLRRDTLQLDTVTDTYRLIHAESDGFPGLMVDKYGDVLSAEVFCYGMYTRAMEILRRLGPRCGAKHYLVRTSPHFLAQEGFERPEQQSDELPAAVVVQEYGTRFRVRMHESSHKTGFFCDQRDNRRRLADFCRDKSVLDLCCYSGGFSVQAKRLGGAAEVTGVDLDENPLATARENANLNQVRVKFVQADVFPYMRDRIRGGHQYDVVVLDPPKLIRSRAEIEEGTRKHYDLNRLAIQLVKPGGILLSCTCAGLLPLDKFLEVIAAAGRNALNTTDETGQVQRQSRNLRILFKSGAAPDHPVATHCPETEYLQAVWIRVE